MAPPAARPGTVSRPARVGMTAAVLAVLLVVAALVASAALDRPAEVSAAEVTIGAPVAVVWAVLTDLEAYPEWNPVVTRARGTLAEGETLELEYVRADGGRETIEVEVTILREERKLRWRRRLLLPGLRDQELEVVLEPMGGEQTAVSARSRYEGVLAPFVEDEEPRREITALLAALRARSEAR